jgi:hypothetical protein
LKSKTATVPAVAAASTAVEEQTKKVQQIRKALDLAQTLNEEQKEQLLAKLKEEESKLMKLVMEI